MLLFFRYFSLKKMMSLTLTRRKKSCVGGSDVRPGKGWRERCTLQRPVQREVGSGRRRTAGRVCRARLGTAHASPPLAGWEWKGGGCWGSGRGRRAGTSRLECPCQPRLPFGVITSNPAKCFTPEETEAGTGRGTGPAESKASRSQSRLARGPSQPCLRLGNLTTDVCFLRIKINQ